jgi:ribosomal protein S18 acetylase RimI-like enzyme
MIRPATPADLPRILAIRDASGESSLSDPRTVTEGDTRRHIEAAELWVWQVEGGPVAGFAAGDRRDGSLWALLVAPGYEGKGIGRALLQAVCDMLRQAGQGMATVRIAPGTIAERHYRGAGWTASGRSQKGELIFRKAL